MHVGRWEHAWWWVKSDCGGSEACGLGVNRKNSCWVESSRLAMFSGLYVLGGAKPDWVGRVAAVW